MDFVFLPLVQFPIKNQHQNKNTNIPFIQLQCIFTMPPKKSPVHKRSPISKTTFGKASTPTASAGASFSTNKYNKLHVTACYGGTEIVLTFTDPTGQKNAYVNPLMAFLHDPANAIFAKDKLHAHYIGKQRDPESAQEYKFDPPTANGFHPPYHMIVTFLDDSQVNKNTPEYREKLGNAYCIVNNSRKVQTCYYGNKPGSIHANHRLEFAGDLTPPGSFDNAPRLSDYVTIGDLMEMLTQMFKNEATGVPLSDAEIAQDVDLLRKYFSPDLIPEVQKNYIPVKRSDGSIPAPDDPDRFGTIDIPNLNLD